MNSETFIPALQTQLECYRKLARLTEMQRQYVRDVRTDLLLELLQQRQVVLEELAKSETVVAPLRREWTTRGQDFSADDRTLAEGLFAETRSLLEQITLSDREDVLVLQQQKLNLGRQINQARSAGQVNRQYAATAYGTRPAQMDVQR